jgi:hypothetical protein
MGIVRLSCETSTRPNFQNFIVWQALKAGFVRTLEVDSWLTEADALDDRVVQVSVAEESDAHWRGLLNPSRAR